MRGFVSRIKRYIILVATLHLSGCAALIDQTGNGNLESVFGALTFQAAERSGDKAEQFYPIWLLPRYYKPGTQQARNITAARNLLSSDKAFTDVFDKCTSELPSHAKWADQFAYISGIPGFDPASIVLAVGNLVYAKVASSIQSRIARLKEAGTSAHAFKVQVAPPSRWGGVNCILVARVLTPDGEKFERVRLSDAAKVERVRMIALIQRRPIGNEGSTFRPLFLRLNFSDAETEADNKGAAKIRVSTTIVIQSFVKSKDGLFTVAEIANQSFAPTSATLGEPVKKLCSPFKKPADGVVEPCEGETNMFPNPPATAPFQLTLVVTETGSALTTADSAEKASKDVLAAIKPTYDDFVKLLAQRVATK